MASRILNVPYRSQFGQDTFLAFEDSGTACVATLLASLGHNVSVAELQDLKRRQGIQAVSGGEVVRLLRACGVQVSAHRGYTLEELRYLIDSGRPAIVRIKYDKILYRWDKSLTGEHYVVVTGFDEESDRIIINDPAYPLGPDGYQRPYSSKVFMKAWAGFDSSVSTNNSLIVPHLANPIDGTEVQAETAHLGVAAFSKEMWVTEPRGLAMYVAADFKSRQIGHLLFGQKIIAFGPTTALTGAGHAWQIVQTELGAIGVVPAACGQERYLADKAPNSPYIIEVQDTKAVQDAHGLALRPRRDIFIPPLGRAAIGERLAVYSRNLEIDGSAWLAVQSSRFEFGWVREQVDGTALVRTVRTRCEGVAIPSPDSPVLTANWFLRTAQMSAQQVTASA
jgi:hypothetical protein